MQTNETNIAPVAATPATETATQPVAPVAETTAAPAKPRKPAKPKAAKPANIPAPVAADTSDRQAERLAARTAIADYYGGAGKSVPFKSASDTFAAIRLDKQPKAPTTRQAALLAAMLLAGDNIDKRGRFTRGGFTYDNRAVQPETGCLSDMLGRTVFHVSGPLTGKQARDAVFRIDLKRARSEISAMLGDKLAKPALAKLDKLAA